MNHWERRSLHLRRRLDLIASRSTASRSTCIAGPGTKSYKTHDIWSSEHEDNPAGPQKHYRKVTSHLPHRILCPPIYTYVASRFENPSNRIEVACTVLAFHVTLTTSSPPALYFSCSCYTTKSRSTLALLSVNLRITRGWRSGNTCGAITCLGH